MSQAAWTFLTNHAHVALSLATDPQITIRDLAIRVGITERAVQNIVNDLVEHGYLQRERIGRRNCYRLVLDLPLRHSVEAHRTLGDLVTMVQP
ncbi:MarR family transcriptional regulator [bacterium]|nr:MarR family transcriptional regulator [bacterium]